MRSYAPAVRPAGYPEPSALTAFAGNAITVAWAELLKLRRDPVELLSRAAQPTLWLLVFGQVMARVRGMPTGGLRYLDFMAPGVLAQSALFIAIFYGVAAIWERDVGVLHKLLVTPASRAALVTGKALSASARALSQAAIVYVLAMILGIRLNLEPLHVLGVLVVIVLGASLFATLSLIIACIVKTRERVMGMGQLLTMPLFFASNAIYPISLMPGWLRVVSLINPLTYEVDALRALMVRAGASAYGIGVDVAVLTAASAVLVTIAARMFPRIIT
ncbi:MAG TPA: ABC transporter permease [bacterium]|nr:ABC transporter permease [bacterium]